MATDEEEGLVETLEILADPELVAAIQEGLEEIAAGHLLSHEEVWAGIAQSSRSSD